MECPLAGCHGRSINIRRHISQCHRYLTKDDHLKILNSYRNLTNARPQLPAKRSITIKEKKRYPDRRCSVCDKIVKRLDIHAVKVHLARRKTTTFKKIMSESLVLAGEERSTKDQVKVTSGNLTITVSDGLKDFLRYFDEYLHNCTTLGPPTCKSTVRMVQDVLRYMCRVEVVDSLTGSNICHLVASMDEVEPLGFLQAKENIFSANCARKIVQACMKAVQCLQSVEEGVYCIDDAVAKATIKQLTTISGKSV